MKKYSDKMGKEKSIVKEALSITERAMAAVKEKEQREKLQKGRKRSQRRQNLNETMMVYHQFLRFL